MYKNVKRLLFLFTIVVSAAAVYEQLQRAPADRSWHGKVFGFIPYDFRPPSPRRFLDAWWNPDDPRLFTERDFGVGWAINLHRLYRLTIGREPAGQEPDYLEA